MSNSENLHLTWTVTYPDSDPIDITYGEDSLFSLQRTDYLATEIISSLEEYRNEYIESFLTLAVVNASMNQTMIECSIADLDFERERVFVNTSGTQLY